jgi:hypothetical protein
VSVLVWWSLAAIVCALIGAGVGRQRGQQDTGLLLGLLLGPVGVVVAALLPDRAEERRPCPHCAEMIRVAASVCRFCGRDVPPVV